MIRALIFLAFWCLVFVVMPQWSATMTDGVTTSGLGTIIQGMWHGWTLPWSAWVVYGGEFTPGLMQYEGACVFETAYKGSMAYSIGFLAGILVLLSSILGLLRGD